MDLSPGPRSPERHASSRFTEGALSLPTQASPRAASRTRHAFALVLFALSLGASPALATHYVVDINGGGDFTTIQAAIDRQAIEFRDTLLVMPGEYADSLIVPIIPAVQYIIGVAGAGATRLRTVRFASWSYNSNLSETTFFEGVTFTSDIAQAGSLLWSHYRRCVFRGRVSAAGDYREGNFNDCDFYGRTDFCGYHANPGSPYARPFEALRFHGAPLRIAPCANGDNAMVGCTFEGPADTLVYLPSEYDRVAFDQCSFSGAGRGLVYGGGAGGGDVVSRCRFSDLAEFGIFLGGPPSVGFGHSPSIGVSDSRFERCGTAVSWVVTTEYGGVASTFVRDTVLASTGNGIELGRSRGTTVTQSIFHGNGGHGLSCLQPANRNDPAFDLNVSQSRFSQNAGDGLHIEETGLPGWYADVRGWHLGVLPVHKVSQSLFIANGGAGLRVTSPRWDIRECVAIDNGDDGVSASTPGLLGGCSLVGNTSVLNRGNGFRVPSMGPSGDTVLVQHNLAVLNAGAGLQTPQYAFQSYAFNSAWGNYLGQHFAGVSPADSNLTVDPRFCDLGAGVSGLGLQQGSPCGASGVYGLIGARPEECPNVTAVGPPPALGATSFAVRPTVARGSVEFVPPSAGPEGRVEVFDLGGRRLWSASLGPASGTLRWRGESDTGRASAGLYWVRFTRAGESQARRLVWLE